MQYRRNILPGGTFFFTLVTHQRAPIFQEETNIALLYDAIQYVKSGHPFELIAYVFLPDHIHIIIEMPEEDGDYPTRLRLMKSYVSRKMAMRPVITNASRISKGEQEIWQRRYWEHTCEDEDDFYAHLDYLHYNPVKHGYVASPYLWGHSSFMSYVKDGIYPLDWGTDVEASIKIPLGCE